MNKLTGYLFAKLSNIESKSEGPDYYLQQYDYKEYPVIKRVNLWENDPVLHPLLGQRVIITGIQQADGITYSQASSEESAEEPEGSQRLLVGLKLEQDTFWLVKPVENEASDQVMKLTLSVLWPYRSIWKGECPSAQLYDFWVEYEGKTIWRWSDEQVFPEVVTPVEIAGGSEHEFSEIWRIDPALITHEGVCTAKVLHIASGKQATTDFKIQFMEGTDD